MAKIIIGAVFALFASLKIGAPVAAEEVTVTTLEWAPYTGSSLPELGATSLVVRQAFEQAEMEAEVAFLPWKRAISEAKNGAPVAYFPGYHCRHTDGFISSEPVGNGPLGLAEHVEAPISWTVVDDLGEQKLKIGTVLGYANTAEFDEKAGTGWVRAISAQDDLTNLKKLLRKRIDAVVIDKLVLLHLLATEPQLKDQAHLIQFDETPLEEKLLHVCFNDSDEGRALRDRFNQGLAQLDTDAIVDSYFKDVF